MEPEAVDSRVRVVPGELSSLSCWPCPADIGLWMSSLMFILVSNVTEKTESGMLLTDIVVLNSWTSLCYAPILGAPERARRVRRAGVVTVIGRSGGILALLFSTLNGGRVSLTLALCYLAIFDSHTIPVGACFSLHRNNGGRTC
jgi:hypothetical protein